MSMSSSPILSSSDQLEDSPETSPPAPNDEEQKLGDVAGEPFSRLQDIMPYLRDCNTPSNNRFELQCVFCHNIAFDGTYNPLVPERIPDKRNLSHHGRILGCGHFIGEICAQYLANGRCPACNCVVVRSQQYQPHCSHSVPIMPIRFGIRPYRADLEWMQASYLLEPQSIHYECQKCATEKELKLLTVTARHRARQRGLTYWSNITATDGKVFGFLSSDKYDTQSGHLMKLGPPIIPIDVLQQASRSFDRISNLYKPQHPKSEAFDIKPFYFTLASGGGATQN